jgi:hypothetical protein
MGLGEGFGDSRGFGVASIKGLMLIKAGLTASRPSRVKTGKALFVDSIVIPSPICSV